MNLTDPTGMSTRVKHLVNGIYEVIGGDLTDDDRNIYLYVQDRNGRYNIRCQSIGITTSITSFYNSDRNAWETGAIIDSHDKSGIGFLKNIIFGNPPLFSDYIVNARNNHTYDFKATNGTSKRIDNIDFYRGMPLGNTINGQTVYSSARDIGNIAAGYIAAANGLSWKLARKGFDGYQSLSSGEHKIEGISTQNAEYYGYKLGFIMNPSIKKAFNLNRSIVSMGFSIIKGISQASTLGPASLAVTILNNLLRHN